MEVFKLASTPLIMFQFFIVTQAFAKQFKMSPDDLDMHVIYDVSHNIAKIEEHMVDGKQKTLLVHRKVSISSEPNLFSINISCAFELLI